MSILSGQTFPHESIYDKNIEVLFPKHYEILTAYVVKVVENRMTFILNYSPTTAEIQPLQTIDYLLRHRKDLEVIFKFCDPHGKVIYQNTIVDFEFKKIVNLNDFDIETPAQIQNLVVEFNYTENHLKFFSEC